MDKIIACIDGSALAGAVCDAAIWISRRLEKSLLFLHSIEKQQQHGADDLTGAIGLGASSALLEQMTSLDQQRGKVQLELGKAMLAAAAERAREQGCDTVETKHRHGDFVEALIELETQARLMVVGRSGENHQHDYKALGSHIENLIRQVHTPVFIATSSFKAPQNFMLAYDGRDTADKALERIISGGLLTGLACHLVSVQNNASAQQDKFNSAKQRLEQQGYEVSASYLQGDIFSALMDYKTRHAIDLLVMGAFAHSKVRQFFLGSNTLRMIEQSQIPLLVLR